LSRDIQPTGLDAAGAAKLAVDNCCRAAGIERGALGHIVVTGNGRKAVPFAKKDVTEIMAFARGAHHVLPSARMGIDLGGQGIRVILMNEQGIVMKFLTNDKCSTGTGCFLDVMAAALETSTDQLGPLALTSKEHHNISNTCTVFAESEVVSLVARGKTKQDIIAGLLDAMAAKVKTMVNQMGVKRDVFFGGGVARNVGAVKALEAAIGVPLHVPQDPDTVGALGAALIAGGI
jgi:predicted CoA-substrate-specific enzyme activase